MKRLLVMYLLCSLPALATLNLALDKPATASGHYVGDKGGAPGDVVDGDFSTEWNAGTYGTETNPQWVMVDLETVYSVGMISLWDETDGTSPGWSNVYNLYSSLDAENWDLIGSGILYDSTDFLDEINLNAKQMRYVKYEVAGGTHFAHLCELEVYQVPEPCTVLLLGLGGFFIRKRRQIVTFLQFILANKSGY